MLSEFPAKNNTIFMFQTSIGAQTKTNFFLNFGFNIGFAQLQLSVKSIDTSYFQIVLRLYPLRCLTQKKRDVDWSINLFGLFPLEEGN